MQFVTENVPTKKTKTTTFQDILNGMSKEEKRRKFGGTPETKARIRDIRARMTAPIPGDNVDQKRTQEKLARDKATCKAYGFPTMDTRVKMVKEDREWDPYEIDDKLASIPDMANQGVPNDLRILAETMGVRPENILELRWNSIAQGLSSWEKVKLAHKCSTEADPVKAWNQAIKDIEPSTLGGPQSGNNTFYRHPDSYQEPYGGIPRWPKALIFTKEEIDEWMRKAENHQVNLITRCEYSGDSLITDRSDRNKTWQIKPNWQGMSLPMARHAVSAAAIQAGIVEGQIRGQVPEVVSKLATDGDAWATLAVSTKHPDFYKIGKTLITLRDKLYFQLEDTDVNNMQKAWERQAALAEAQDIQE